MTDSHNVLLFHIIDKITKCDKITKAEV